MRRITLGLTLSLVVAIPASMASAENKVELSAAATAKEQTPPPPVAAPAPAPESAGRADLETQAHRMRFLAVVAGICHSTTNLMADYNAAPKTRPTPQQPPPRAEKPASPARSETRDLLWAERNATIILEWVARSIPPSMMEYFSVAHQDHRRMVKPPTDTAEAEHVNEAYGQLCDAFAMVWNSELGRRVDSAAAGATDRTKP